MRPGVPLHYGSLVPLSCCTSGGKKGRCQFWRHCKGKAIMNSTEQFEALVGEHYEPLFRFALSLTQSEFDAWDLTQQTFYVWATKGQQLRDISKVKTWLFTTLQHAFLVARRKQSRFTSPPSLTWTNPYLFRALRAAARAFDRASEWDLSTTSSRELLGDL